MEKGTIAGGFLLPHPPVAVSEVGQGREQDAAKTLAAYGLAAERLRRLSPDTVVVVSPHAPMFSDYMFIYDSKTLEGDFGQFGAKEARLSFEQDDGLRSEFMRLMGENGVPGGGLSGQELRRMGLEASLDHGVLVPLHFLSQGCRFRLVAMSCSGLDTQRLYLLGTLIRRAAENTGRRVVIVASGDMSHKVNAESPYGEDPAGAQFDALVSNALSAGDIPALLSIDPELREKAAECGYRSIVILCGAFDGVKPAVELLSYEAPFGIGYCAAAFEPTEETAPPAFELAYKKRAKAEESPQVRIARRTLETFVREEKALSAADFGYLPREEGLFDDKAGVFVSLKKFGELRGCIGTTGPTTASIAEEICQNAVSAGTRDPRFEPVRADELEFLEYSVDVLSKPEKTSRARLDPKVFGVIVRRGGRSGLLLPDLEGVDSVARQLEIACSKAGIDPKSDIEIFKFTVTRYR